MDTGQPATSFDRMKWQSEENDIGGSN
jgi:hypothetical protein